MILVPWAIRPNGGEHALRTKGHARREDCRHQTGYREAREERDSAIDLGSHRKDGGANAEDRCRHHVQLHGESARTARKGDPKALQIYTLISITLTLRLLRADGETLFMYTMPMKERQHTTLYRQYRPSSFREVHGQPHVTETLEKSIKNKKIAHAYLFSGSRGTGKTTVARILAGELGVSSKDLYEIDAASNRGIDDIRALREGVYSVPFDSPYKLYIIDEAHMLTKDAWNAFLKTLEEPPAHAIFVLATTERDKVPETIQSRCEIYTFKQPTREMLAEVVVNVAKKEGYALQRAAAELVALLAEGSFRDALSILQKVLSVSKDKKIDLAEVEAVSGAPRGELIRQILSALAKKDAGAALKALRAAQSENMDPRTLTKLLIHRMRAILLLRYAPDLAAAISKEMPEADIVLAQEISKEAGINSDTLRTLLEAYERMAYAAIPHLPLELAVIEISGQK